MQEMWVRSLGQEDALEKELAKHSSTLAWRIQWTEEPGGLQSMGSEELDTPTHTSLQHQLKGNSEHRGFLISISNLKKFPLKMHSFAWVLIHCNSLNFQRD